MQEVYTKNSALGDPDSLAGQMKLSQAKIDKLQADLAQHEVSDDVGVDKHSPC